MAISLSWSAIASKLATNRDHWEKVLRKPPIMASPRATAIRLVKQEALASGFAVPSTMGSSCSTGSADNRTAAFLPLQSARSRTWRGQGRSPSSTWRATIAIIAVISSDGDCRRASSAVAEASAGRPEKSWAKARFASNPASEGLTAMARSQNAMARSGWPASIAAIEASRATSG